MADPYWQFETVSGNKICVSVRGEVDITIEEYQSYLNNFLTDYAKYIMSVDETTRFACGSMCTIIRLNISLSDMAL